MSFSTDHTMRRAASNSQGQLQKAILEKVALNHPLPEILSALCVHVEQIVPSSLCSIMLVNEQTGSLTVGAAPTCGNTAGTIFGGVIAGEFAGACKTAIHTKTFVIIEDTETDPRWAPPQEIAQTLGIKSCWSLPIMAEGQRVLGTVALSHRQPRLPTPEHLELLESASSIANIAIQRREMDRALTESEQCYRTFHEDSSSMYFTIEIDGTILSVNKSGAQQLGYSVAELLGQPVSRLFVEEDRAAIREKFNQCVRNPGQLHNWEARKIRKDGTRLWVRERARIVKGQEDKDVCLIAWDNITEYKQAEEQKRRQEQAVRDLYEIMASPNCSFEHRVRSLLELGCCYFRLPIGLLTHRIDDELELQFVRSSNPAFKEGSRVPLSQTFCGTALFADTPIGFEHAATSEWRNHPEYHTLGVESYFGTKVLIEGGTYGTFCFTGPDPYAGTFSEGDKDFLRLMSKWVGGELDRQAAESVLQTNFALMKAVLEGTTDAFFVKDLEGRYLMMNVAGTQLLHTTHEIIGKTDDDIFTAKTASLIKQQDATVYQTETTHIFEEEILLKDDKRIFLTRKGPYRDAEGHIIGLFGNARDITQRKQAEEKLQDIHLALSHAMPGIAQLDPYGCYTEVNEFYASMLGYDPSDLVGNSWEPTVHTDDLPAAMTAYQIMLETGKGEFEARAIRKDGSFFYKHVLMVKRVDAQGTLVGHHCFMRNISERREAEETLRFIVDATSSVVSTDFFRSLLCHLAATLKVKYAMIAECTDSTNTRVTTLAFLQGEEFVENVTYDLAGTPCEHVMQGELCCYPQNVQSLFPLDQDLVALHAESYIGLPLYDSSGTLIGNMAVFDEHPMDLDTKAESLMKIFAGRAGAEIERHRGLTALQESEGRLRQIIDLVPHFIFAKDHNGAFILANQAVADVYGTTLDQLIGKTDADFNSSEEEVEHFQKDDHEVLDSMKVKSIQEEQITDSTGEIRYLETTKIPFVFADTTRSTVLGVAIDITRQRKATAQLEEAYGQLQDMTTRLKAAEESERKRIARELHDEFGQTLTSLKFDIAWLQRRLSEPPSISLTPSLLKKVEAMSLVTDQLIQTVRRIATSLRPSILDDFGLRPALEWHVHDFEQRTGISCTFSTNLDGQSLTLNNEQATAIFRMTQELFTNILRHAEASEVNLSLVQEDDSLVLLVIDNGRGMTHRDNTDQPLSLGLIGIKERAASLGGTFVITGNASSGTHAIVRIPLT